MKKLKPSTQYKKDVKRILNNPRKQVVKIVLHSPRPVFILSLF